MPSDPYQRFPQKGAEIGHVGSKIECKAGKLG